MSIEVTSHYPSFEDIAVLLARQGLEDSKSPELYSVGFQGHTQKLAHAVLEAGWTHGGAAFTVDGERGYIATNLSAGSVGALPGSSTGVQLANYGDKYARQLVFTDPSIVKKPRLAEAVPGIVGGGVGGVTLGSEAVASQLTESHAIYGLLAAAGTMALSLAGGHVKMRRDVACFTAQYHQLKRDIIENGQSYNASLINFDLKKVIDDNAVNDITVGLWPKISYGPIGVRHINVFGTVSGLMQAAGSQAADLWVNRLQPVAAGASESADQYQRISAALKTETDFNRRIGDRKSPRSDELSEQKEAVRLELAGHMAAFAAINGEIRCEERKRQLKEKINELALIRPIDGARPFAGELEGVYSMLFSGLLKLDPKDKDSISVMKDVLSGFDSLSERVSHQTHIDRMYAHFRKSYPKLFGERASQSANK